MGIYVAQETVKLLINAGKTVHGARILMFGVTLKQDTRNARNRQAVDLAHELEGYGVEVLADDPLAGNGQIKRLSLTPTACPFLGVPNQPRSGASRQGAGCISAHAQGHSG